MLVCMDSPDLHVFSWSSYYQSSLLLSTQSVWMIHYINHFSFDIQLSGLAYWTDSDAFRLN